MRELREIVAKNIQSLRNFHKITQATLAEELNYSDKAVSKWERAESIPDITVLKQIADYFDVTVDYLISEEHPESELRGDLATQQKQVRRFYISALATISVWFLATVIFVLLNTLGIGQTSPIWLIYVYSIPASAIVALVFSSVFAKSKYNLIIISVLIWSLILAIYLTVLVLSGTNLWLLFIIGIPSEIILILWFKALSGKVKA